MKIGIVSLGCAKNLVDTQNIMSFLKASGHQFTDNPAKAEVIIVNTCGFINDAKEESINTILRMAEFKEKQCRFLIVTGCLVQRYLDELKAELPEVDLFIPISQYRQLEKILNDFLDSETQKERELLLATPTHWAYLRIADGCSNRCAYCAIPLIRKDYISTPFEELISQAKQLERIGVKELNIIAQDTTRYGKDLYGRLRLHELLQQLDEMDFKWIRIMYMYPDEIYDELLETMAKCKKVIPYFDIPIQHANDRLLKLMNRRGSQAEIKERVEKIRSMFTDPILRTTIIVGFPTEEDEEFKEMVEVNKEIRWDRLGAFTYSLEEDTASYTMEPKVDEEVAKERLAILMEVQNRISLENNQKYLDKEIEVLVENYDSIHNNYTGRGRMQAPDDIDGHVQFTSEKDIHVGEIVNVKITRVEPYDLFGIC